MCILSSLLSFFTPSFSHPFFLSVPATQFPHQPICFLPSASCVTSSASMLSHHLVHPWNFKNPFQKLSYSPWRRSKSNRVSIKRGKQEKGKCPLPLQTLPFEITDDNRLRAAFYMLLSAFTAMVNPYPASSSQCNVTSSKKASLITPTPPRQAKPRASPLPCHYHDRFICIMTSLISISCTKWQAPRGRGVVSVLFTTGHLIRAATE